MAIRRRSSRKKSYKRYDKKFLTAANIQRGIGAGFAGAAGATVDSMLGGKLGGNLAAGALGIVLSKYTKGIPSKMGQGMVIKAIGDFTEDQIAPMVLGVFDKKTTSSSSVADKNQF